MDGQLRSTHRQAAQGDPRAGIRLLRERLRAGELDPQRLRLAAYLGDASAQAACGFAPQPQAFPIWLDGLDDWGKEAQVRAGVALLRRGLEERANLPDRPERGTLRALKEAEAWCLDPSDPRRPSWWVLEEAQAAALVASGIDQEIGWLACEVVDAAGSEAPALQDACMVALRVLSAEVAREAVQDALLPWALGEGDPIRG